MPLHLIIEKAWEFRKDQHLYIAFINLKAAFNTMDHGLLWNILKTLGVPPKITVLFKQLYPSAESCVHVNGRDSEWLHISSGVRQGCVYAPELFKCVIHNLMTRVCEHVPGVSLSEYKLADLEYAFQWDGQLTLGCSQHVQQGGHKAWPEDQLDQEKLMYVGDSLTHHLFSLMTPRSISSQHSNTLAPQCPEQAT